MSRKKEVTLNSHVLHPSCACSSHPTNTLFVNILFSKFRSLHQCLMTHNHCRCSGCVQPMSPDTATVGVYFPTPRKYRQALNSPSAYMSCGRARTHDHRISSQRLTLSRHTGRHLSLLLRIFVFFNITTIYLFNSIQ